MTKDDNKRIGPLNPHCDPCPFCGCKCVSIGSTTREGIFEWTLEFKPSNTNPGYTQFHTICENIKCGAEGPFGKTPKEAAEKWNKRQV